MDITALERGLKDPLWRYDNLYTVETKEGEIAPFRMNWAQRELATNPHPFSLVLKARQLGFTTLFQLIMLDAMIFHANTNCGVIAHNKDDAKKFFTKKIRDVYSRLPEQIRAAVPARQDAAQEMAFGNGSHISVGTSHRSGTLQYLHVSELGKIAATRPDKAREIRTGALNTIQAGQVVFIESTAEGQDGDFYELVQDAREIERSGRELGPLDFKLYFFPWFREPTYRMDPRFAEVTPEHDRYFDALEDEHGIVLDDWQAAWYAAKKKTQQDDMKREYPSTIDEAFEAAIEGAYYSQELETAEKQGRIGDWPYDPKLGAVMSSHDIGRNQNHTTWLFQRDQGLFRFVGYHENEHGGATAAARWLKEWITERDAIYERHFLPHDGGTTDWSADIDRRQVFESLGARPCSIVQRTMDVTRDIQHVRSFFGLCKFDRTACALGLRHLRNYRREWDDIRGVWKDKPRPDGASHGADGIRTAAMADKAGMLDMYEDESWDAPRDEGRSRVTGY